METIKELKEICQPHRKTSHPRDFGYLKHRELSVYITRIILKVAGRKIKPNHISLFNILFGIAILLLVAITKNQALSVLLLLLFYFSFLLDKVDGEVARYKKLITLRGAYLDEIYHVFVQNGLILALAAKFSFLYLGIAGLFLFFLARYLNKVRYFIHAKYKADKGEFSMKKESGKSERFLVGILNTPLLKLTSIARRHDIFLISALLFSIFFFNSGAFWFWFLAIWTTMLAVNVLRFLVLNGLNIDRDVQLVDESKL